MTSISAIGRRIPSFGFSGAGFLTCYHFGVAECLLKYGLLLPRGSLPTDDTTPILTGVSGGALVATALAIGVSPEDGMKATLEIAARTQQAGGLLDHLKPGFSLIDQVEEVIITITRDIDEELALRRIDFGRLLHIGLTDRRAFPRFRRNPDAYVYVNAFQSVEEIVSACILSSYVPGLTGPISDTTFGTNGAVRRANGVLLRMMEQGSIKSSRGVPLQSPLQRVNLEGNRSQASTYDSQQLQNNIVFWDGGLANLFPRINLETCIVTPFTASFTNPTISPSRASASHSLELDVLSSRPTICLENLLTIRYIAFSSNSLTLEGWFEKGYNDANHFLLENNKKPSLPIHLYSFDGERHNTQSFV